MMLLIRTIVFLVSVFVLCSCDLDFSGGGGEGPQAQEDIPRINQTATLVQVTAVDYPYFQVVGTDQETGQRTQVLYKAEPWTVFTVEFQSCSNHQVAWTASGFNGAPRGGGIPNTLVPGDFVGIQADTTVQDPVRGAFQAVTVFVDHPNCLTDVTEEVTTPAREIPR